jgi:hypothetical protein
MSRERQFYMDGAWVEPSTSALLDVAWLAGCGAA